MNAEFEYEVKRYVGVSMDAHSKGTIIWKSDGKKYSREYKPDFVEVNNKLIPAEQVSWLFHTRENYNGESYVQEFPDKKRFHIKNEASPNIVLLDVPMLLLTNCNDSDWIKLIQSHGAAPRFLGWEQLNGSKCGVLEFTYVDTRGSKELVYPRNPMKVWIDVEHGLTPVQIVAHVTSQTDPNIGSDSTIKISELKQINSVWVPQKMTWFFEDIKNGVKTPRDDYILTAKNMEIGVSRSPDEFNVKFPRGAWVDDQVSGTTYNISSKPH